MKRMICAAIMIVVFISMLSGCASWERGMKSISSDLSGGVNRTLTVYDYNGEAIQTWTGKMDVSNENDRTMFDMDGKRTIIRGGIIVVQEN